MTRTFLVRLFEHNLWANRTLLKACEAATVEHLDAPGPGGYGSAAATWVHLLEAEQRYAGRVTRSQVGGQLQAGERWPGVPRLLAAAEWSGSQLIGAAAGIDEEGTFRVDWDGVERDVPNYLNLMQAILHAAEHRTQIRTVLSAQRIAMPDLDAWDWADVTPGVLHRSPS